MEVIEKIIALVPLRGGSQSIPRKNIKELAGRPLCEWAIRSALDSSVFPEVWVSTDDEEIASVVDKFGVRVHWRDPATATRNASSESAMLDFAKAYPDFDIMALIQATSPLTRPEDFRNALAAFEREKADSLVTVTRQHRFLWSSDGRALNYDPAQRPRRQDWSGELIENGAFYFTRRQLLLDKECRLGGKIVTHLMSAPTFYEIDEPEDWIILETLARRYGYIPQ